MAEIISFARSKEWKLIKPSASWVDWIYSKITFYKWHWGRSVHRLMWEAFLWLDVNDKTMCVLHNDETLINWRLNNVLSNLRLWTHTDNMRDCINKWRKPERKMVKVYKYDLNDNFVKIRNWINNAAKGKNIDPSSIVKCCKWKLKTAWKAKWKYLPKKDSN